MVFIGYVETETDRALLFQDHFWEKSDWIPKGQIEILRSTDTHEVRIIASPWICGKKRIREFEARLAENIEDPPGQSNGKEAF